MDSSEVLLKKKSLLHLQSQKEGELSSAGSEHLPYKQRVGGSNPSAPTKRSRRESDGFFYSCSCPYSGSSNELSHGVILEEVRRYRANLHWIDICKYFYTTF